VLEPTSVEGLHPRVFVRNRFFRTQFWKIKHLSIDPFIFFRKWKIKWKNGTNLRVARPSSETPFYSGVRDLKIFDIFFAYFNVKRR
jgi:hypothetical protein